MSHTAPNPRITRGVSESHEPTRTGRDFWHAVRRGDVTLDAFMDHLREEAGSALRVVSWYAADDFGGLYVRDDLDREAVVERTRFLAERLMGRPPNARGSPMEELGQERAMVQVREQAVILRFPVEADRGLVVTLDVDAARDLHRFVTTCSERLEGADLSFRSSAMAA